MVSGGDYDRTQEVMRHSPSCNARSSSGGVCNCGAADEVLSKKPDYAAQLRPLGTAEVRELLVNEIVDALRSTANHPWTTHYETRAERIVSLIDGYLDKRAA